MKLHMTPSVILRILIWSVLLFGGAWYAVIEDWENPLFHDIRFHLVTGILGYLLLILAFRAAANGGRELAKGRQGDIPRLETNRLVTTGIYRCMRHPMLFGLTLLPLGWGFLLGSPTFITKVAPLEILFIVFMVVVFEEMEVKKKFTDAYSVYSQNVPIDLFQTAVFTVTF